MSKYLSVNSDGTFGFKDDVINKISNADIALSDDIYDQFFESQAEGRQYKIKNAVGSTFDDIFEEYTPTPVTPQPSDIEVLQQQNSQLLLSSAQQSQTISDLQTQNAAIMLQLAQSQPGGTI